MMAGEMITVKTSTPLAPKPSQGLRKKCANRDSSGAGNATWLVALLSGTDTWGVGLVGL